MKKIAVVIGLLACSSAFSNPSKTFWQDADNGVELQFRQLSSINKQTLKKRSLSLDETSLKELLTGNKKLASRSLSEKIHQSEIDLPLPDGGFVRVRVTDSPILSPQIAAQYPDIKTWSVQGVDDPAISGRLDFTSKGFHGMISMSDGDIVYIDPDKSRATNLYHSLSKRQNASHFKTDFNCKVHDDHAVYKDAETRQLSAKKLAQKPALDLITYRLAIAGTGEYTASQGGTSTSAYSSMVTTINRVNQIYQRDLGIKLQIVSGSSLAYTNAATDPYTNNDANNLVSENIQNLYNTVGVNNYDIGHVFAQGTIGGLAYIGVACMNSVNTSNGVINGIKGGGATGIPNPQGELFSIEFVAHEVGHQLGATHTFNSTENGCGNGNRTAVTAVEPGSGSTIMSYSGNCGVDNLQLNSDAMFHWKSIDQINKYTRVSENYTNGNSCGTRTSTGHQNPEADAGSDSMIPTTTPFLLDGSATGGSSYTWDQIDTGTASGVDVDTGNNAIIRTLIPASDPDRYIPRLSDLFSASSTTGEKLPQVDRELNFAFVVRDSNGGVDSDLKKITVKNTGVSFSVLSQPNAQTFITGQSINVDWNVAGTNVAPINCSKVDIQLLRVNGVKNSLLAGTNNDGSEQIVVPLSTPAMTNARIMVACSSQPFFQISTGNIEVQQGVDDIAPVITLNGASTLEIFKGSTYTDAGATAVDNIDGTVLVTKLSTVNTADIGTYTVTFSATDAAGNIATKVRTVNVVADTTAPVITLNGADSVEVLIGTTYTDSGASAIDDLDGVVLVSTVSTVNTDVPGTYTVTYTASDQANNSAIKVRTVKVIADTTAPVIVLFGSSTINIAKGSSYTDSGATATDNVDGGITVTTSGVVDTDKLGTYTMTYTATDAAGNTATEERVVTVIGDDNTGKNAKNPEADSSGGGSISLLLLPLAIIGLRRRLQHITSTTLSNRKNSNG